MSNCINRFMDEVKLIEVILGCKNVTQCERVKRIYHNAFTLGVLSDQSFFEAINWYAKKCIRIAAERSLRCSKKYDIDGVRYWNSVIIVLTPLLGDKPWQSVQDLYNVADLMLDDQL